MNEQLHNPENIRNHQIETISAIAMFGVVLFITAYALYYWENQFKTQDVQEKGFSTIVTPRFNGPVGEHPQLKQYAQKLLAFPKSYKHIETIYINHDQKFFAQSIFSGKNIHEIEEIFCLKATYSYEGHIINSPTFC